MTIGLSGTKIPYLTTHIALPQKIYERSGRMRCGLSTCQPSARYDIKSKRSCVECTKKRKRMKTTTLLGLGLALALVMGCDGGNVKQSTTGADGGTSTTSEDNGGAAGSGGQGGVTTTTTSEGDTGGSTTTSTCATDC